MNPKLLHVLRIALFICLLLLIHVQQQRFAVNISTSQDWSDVWPTIAAELPAAKSVSAVGTAIDAVNELHPLPGSDGTIVGFVARTSPAADHILGFSGPTDVLLIFNSQQTLLAAAILSSRDTREHVRSIRNDSRFLQSLAGKNVNELAEIRRLDAVSGATLTSLAILESIRFRLADSGQKTGDRGRQTSLRFPDSPRKEDIRLLYPNADQIEPTADSSLIWVVKDNAGEVTGRLLRTSPAADNIVGYQGPTDTLIAVDNQDMVTGVAVGVSFDNEPYVDYVREDDYFRQLFRERTIESLSRIDLTAEQIEGVSGATMTSMSVARGMIVAAQAYVDELNLNLIRQSSPNDDSWLRRYLTGRNLSTVGITLFGTVLGLSQLKRRRWLRILFQLLLIGWLGLINGDMVSQALLLGWARNGIAWQNALGLTFLTFAALLIPICTGHNVYCSHLCPHGALQQLVRNRLPWKLRLTAAWQRRLKWTPGVLIAWVVAIGLLNLPFSAVDIEPFDAWLWMIAGIPTIVIAVTSIIASLFVPMAYCRFGCPTGAALNFLRSARVGRFTARDGAAILLLAAALLTYAMPGG